MNDEPNVFTRCAQVWDIPYMFDAETVCEFDRVYELSDHIEETCKELFSIDDSCSGFLHDLLERAFNQIDWYDMAKSLYFDASVNAQSYTLRLCCYGKAQPETDHSGTYTGNRSALLAWCDANGFTMGTDDITQTSDLLVTYSVQWHMDTPEEEEED